MKRYIKEDNSGYVLITTFFLLDVLDTIEENTYPYSTPQQQDRGVYE